MRIEEGIFYDIYFYVRDGILCLKVVVCVLDIVVYKKVEWIRNWGEESVDFIEFYLGFLILDGIVI